MKNITKALVYCFAIYKLTTVSAQENVIYARANDLINLDVGTVQGTIQWQHSTDGVSWQAITGGNQSAYNSTLTAFPSYYRARIQRANCEHPDYSDVIQFNEIITKRWSVASSWPNGKPTTNDQVVIPSDTYMILDENTPSLGGLTIEGTLEFDQKNLALTSKWIMIHGGTLRVGSEENPHKFDAIITLNDQNTNADIMSMGTRGIVVMGGNLELHGPVPSVIWSKINAHAPAGATSLSLIENVDWSPGDQIVIAPTDYYQAGYGASITQRTELSAVNNNVLTLSNQLNAHRWGLLQYPTSDGMSLNQSGLVDPPVALSTATTPLVLDERAEVGNLSRNIVIQAPDDHVWQSQGFGVHTMIMPGGTAHVEGVEFRRAGQRGRLRRYAFHWHILSYSGSQTLEDATGQYFKGNTINVSENRGIVIHGTNGVLVQDNIVYNVKGHGVFMEDAVERRNTIDHNLVLHVRNPNWGDQLMQHEVGDLGSSGFWIANPDNVITNNVAADCETFGFWLAFPDRPFGDNDGVLADDGVVLRPNRLLFGVFDNNTMHSNKNDGLHIDDPQFDDQGNTRPLQYWSTTDGRTDFNSSSFETLRRFTLSRVKTWKNMDNGSWDRGVWTDLVEFVSADNCGRFFAGSGAEGVIERSLIVGTSLNHMMNGTGRPEIADFQFFSSASPTAFATYHSAFSMRQNIVVNFQVTEYDRAGVFATDDYYVRPVDLGQVRNYDNLLVQSDPGVKLASQNDYFTLASALWDPYGHWGPAGNYLVYDDPFLTHEKTITIPEPGVHVIGGVSVPGPFYGFLSFVLFGEGPTPPQNWDFEDIMAIHVDRLDPNNLSTVVASWDVAEADIDWTLQHMRDFATVPEGIYELSFPGQSNNPTDFHMQVENMTEASDTQVMGIQFEGSINPTVFLQQVTYPTNYHVYSQVNSLQEVIDSAGETYWQDAANNLVWVKLRGGRWASTGNEFDSFEDAANQTMNLRIREAN